MSGRTKLGVLVSGSGSNLQALLDACAQPGFPAEVALVVSNVPTAFALERARKAGVPAVVLEHKAFGSRADFEKALVETLVAAGVEWVCLAGFMRLLGVDFLGRFAGKVLNIHPSLLPAFPGLHAPAAGAGARGEGGRVHGALRGPGHGHGPHHRAGGGAGAARGRRGGADGAHPRRRSTGCTRWW